MMCWCVNPGDFLYQRVNQVEMRRVDTLRVWSLMESLLVTALCISDEVLVYHTLLSNCLNEWNSWAADGRALGPRARLNINSRCIYES